MSGATPDDEAVVDRPAPIRRTAAALALLVAGLVAVLALSDGAASSTAAILGRPAPAIHGSTLDGEPVDLDRGRGRWTVVNFFAPWCVECRIEHPELEELARWGQERGRLDVISVVVDSSIGETDAFLVDHPASWPFVIDPEGRTSVDYGLVKVPETFLVTPDGFVVAKYSGAVTAEAVRRVVQGSS